MFAGFSWQVGWTQKNLVEAFKANQKELTLILKKPPCHIGLTGFQKKPRAYKELPKLNVGPKLRRSYGRARSDQMASQGSVDRSVQACWSWFLLSVPIPSKWLKGVTEN
jgi:hypothetical protein